MSRRRNRNDNSYWDNFPGLFDLPPGENADSTPIRELDPAALERPKRLRFISFGSGSSGNCAYVGTADCGVLIDAGVDNNKVVAELAANAIDPEGIRGILLTHDHGDHVRYAYALLRRHRDWRLYATPKTLNGILRRHNVSRRISDYHSQIYKEFPFSVGELEITAFETSHDGTDNCGFCIKGGGTVFVVATDTGVITERADYYIRRARHLMIEANYDAEMLRTGKYPMLLKARIASATGHMDNVATAAYLAEVASGAEMAEQGYFRNVFLCHLSLDNNRPEIALGAVGDALRACGLKVGDGSGSLADRVCDTHVSVLPRLESSQLYELK